MIFAYVGKTGNGKSAYASSLIRKSIASGIKVYTNIHVKETSPLFRYFKDFSVLTDVTEGEIICDEAQTYLNSRDWAKLPQSFQLLLQQHRHRGLNFHGFTQSIKRMDTVFRELVQEFYSLHKIR